jgi:hypothetical protein
VIRPKPKQLRKKRLLRSPRKIKNFEDKEVKFLKKFVTAETVTHMHVYLHKSTLAAISKAFDLQITYICT